jgi:hypothetical protein
VTYPDPVLQSTWWSGYKQAVEDMAHFIVHDLRETKP